MTKRIFSRVNCAKLAVFCHMRRKKEEGRRKREEGRGKKEEGRGKRGRGKRRRGREGEF
ncbi:MAG: hypothetical protein HC894_17815 [Microcoleus sp. SM1_3_4]|nr:hypothetical protein [Microcoleus sp. SM1_3_4]